MNICRQTIALVTLTLLFQASPARAQSSLTSDDIVQDKVILTLRKDGNAQSTSQGLLKQLRESIAESAAKNQVKHVDYLYRKFCTFVQNNETTSLETHLKLINNHVASLPSLSLERIKQIKAYFRKPTTEFCNQFVITFRSPDLQNLADTLTSLEISRGITVEELQPVHRYQVKKGALSSLVDPTSRPGALISIISSPALNGKFVGNRWKNTGEVIDDTIDNDGNGYADDIHGINSKETEITYARANRDGFVTLAVANDQNDQIEYTTVEAAEAILYSIHHFPDTLIVPFAESDQVLNRLVAIGRRLGISTNKKLSAAPDSKSDNPRSKVAHLPIPVLPAKSSKTVSLIGARFADEEGTRVCSFFINKKSKLKTVLSRVDGKKLFGKSSWNRLTIDAKIAAMKFEMSTMAAVTTKDSPKSIKKLKKLMKDLLAAKKQLARCVAEGDSTQHSNVKFKHVKPILQKQCFVCHSANKSWDENTEEFFVRSGRVVPGSFDQSVLYMTLRNNPEGFQPANMPQGLPALSDLNILLIRLWISGISQAPVATPTPKATLNPLTPIRDGQRLYAENCASCHLEISRTTKFGSTYEKVKAALDPNSGNPSMRALGRVLSDEQIRLIVLALNTKTTSQADNWTLNIGTASYVASVFRSIFLPDDVTTYTAQDTAISTRITQDIIAANKLRFFGGLCDRFETGCLAEGELIDQKPTPNVIRTGLEVRLIDDILSSANPRAVQNALAKIGRTTTSPIDAKAVQDLFHLIHPGLTLPDEIAASTAAALKGVPNYTQFDYWRYLIKFLCSSGHWEVF